MVSRVLARLSYANVVATLALFIALGGTSYAAATIGSGNIKDNSIRSRDIHNGTIAPKDLNASARVQKLYGNIDGDDGSLVRGRGIRSVERAGQGWYEVRFTRKITNCVLLSSLASKDATNPTSATIGTGIFPAAPTAQNLAFVLIRNDFADTRVDADFSVAALC
jgi:hypothetical protein